MAAGQALAYLDGHRPETVDGTLEWQLAGLAAAAAKLASTPRLRLRRSHPPRPNTAEWARDRHPAASAWPVPPSSPSLPLGVAGRATVGLGKRLTGQSAEDVAGRTAADAPPSSCSRCSASSRAAR